MYFDQPTIGVLRIESSYIHSNDMLVPRKSTYSPASSQALLIDSIFQSGKSNLPHVVPDLIASSQHLFSLSVSNNLLDGSSTGACDTNDAIGQLGSAHPLDPRIYTTDTRNEIESSPS